MAVIVVLGLAVGPVLDRDGDAAVALPVAHHVVVAQPSATFTAPAEPARDPWRILAAHAGLGWIAPLGRWAHQGRRLERRRDRAHQERGPPA